MTDHTPTTEYVPQPWRMEGFYSDQYAKTSASLDFALDYDDETFDRHEREFLADLKAYAAEQQVLALREAANDMHRSWCQEGGPSDWLDARADRIEQGGES